MSEICVSAMKRLAYLCKFNLIQWLHQSFQPVPQNYIFTLRDKTTGVTERGAEINQVRSLSEQGRWIGHHLTCCCIFPISPVSRTTCWQLTQTSDSFMGWWWSHSENAAKPVTTVQDWISIFVSVKQLDIFKESVVWKSPAVFVVMKTVTASRSKIVSLNTTRPQIHMYHVFTS